MNEVMEIAKAFGAYSSIVDSDVEALRMLAEQLDWELEREIQRFYGKENTTCTEA